jgi:phytoene synthase
MTPDDYCADRIAGSDVHYSLIFLAPALRRAVTAVYACTDEIAEINTETQDPVVAHTKIEWWRDEIARLYDRQARHPTARALMPVVAAHELPREHFLALLDETARSVGPVRFADFEALHEHCRRMGATTTRLVAGVLGSTDPATDDALATLGAAMHLADRLRRLGQDVRHERLFLPLDDLRRFDVAEQELLTARPSPALKALMAFEIERTGRQFDNALKRLPARERPAQLPLLILAALRRAHLEEVRREGCRVLERRVALTPLRQLWIAWSTRRQERRLFVQEDQHSATR